MKTKMKIAVCTLICMTMACAAASAEGGRQGNKNEGRPQMQQGQMSDRNGMQQQGQTPNMNDQNGQNQMPSTNDRNDRNQVPNMKDLNNDRQPNGGAQNNGQKPDDENAPKDMPTGLDAKKLLEDGVIDEDTYNAIEDYLKQNAPEDSEQEDGRQPSEKPENEQDNTQQPPEKPEGEQADDDTEKPELPEIGGGLDEVQLKSLLDAGVITQEQYDALLELLTDSGDAA